jgi:hypothetical protein
MIRQTQMLNTRPNPDFMGQRAGYQHTLTAAVMRRDRNERHQRDPKLILPAPYGVQSCINPERTKQMTTQKLTTQQLIEGVRAHARRNYNKGGWDILVECWDDKDIGAQIMDGDTLPRAIARIKRVLNDVHSYREEIQSTAW